MGLLDDIFAIRTELTNVTDEVKQAFVGTLSEVTQVGQDLKDEAQAAVADLKGEASDTKAQSKVSVDGIIRPHKPKK